MSILANLGQENRGTGVCFLARFSGAKHISICLVFQKPGQYHFFDTFDGTWNSTYVSKSGIVGKYECLILGLQGV